VGKRECVRERDRKANVGNFWQFCVFVPELWESSRWLHSVWVCRGVWLCLWLCHWCCHPPSQQPTGEVSLFSHPTLWQKDTLCLSEDTNINKYITAQFHKWWNIVKVQITERADSPLLDLKAYMSSFFYGVFTWQQCQDYLLKKLRLGVNYDKKFRFLERTILLSWNQIKGLKIEGTVYMTSFLTFTHFGCSFSSTVFWGPENANFWNDTILISV